ncbi:kinetochore protein mis14, putative [Metarhizium acridum CQMa 102]|uniref:Kinetochore protein mis14, putative n=1 Tax=Metarhizium acridum (strain CQMa 102) TaxID=655827 RepID=E9DV72_METAQ|nr:kinetochore protein mis14, putative [Metarhizium acridum CQMa 102]EFY92496.1 kinetochore protein mis14, putative [Metarhizium acridum CQMa 102]
MDQDSAASQAQRKIELQSPEDLAYLVAKVRGAAAARINEAFPHVPGQGEDELRNQIESLVNEVRPPPPPPSTTQVQRLTPKQYIDRTFTLAAPNLSINGLPVSSTEYLSPSPATRDTYEPFDARKRQRVAELISQEEKLLEEVAALKRSVPGKAADEQAARVRDAIRHDEEMVEARRAAVIVDAGKEGGRLRVDRLERQDGVEAGFRGAVEALGRLKRDMPSVVAKMERARVAGEYVLNAK